MTCVKRMKVCFKIKEIIDFNVSWNFQSTWTWLDNVIRKMKKQFLSYVFKKWFQLPLRNLKNSFFVKSPQLLGQSPWIFLGTVFTNIYVKTKKNSTPAKKKENMRRTLSQLSINLIITVKSYFRFHWNF